MAQATAQSGGNMGEIPASFETRPSAWVFQWQQLYYSSSPVYWQVLPREKSGQSVRR